MTDRERRNNLALLLKLATQENLPEEISKVKVNDVLFYGERAIKIEKENKK